MAIEDDIRKSAKDLGNRAKDLFKDLESKAGVTAKDVKDRVQAELQSGRLADDLARLKQKAVETANTLADEGKKLADSAKAKATDALTNPKKT